MIKLQLPPANTPLEIEIEKGSSYQELRSNDPKYVSRANLFWFELLQISSYQKSTAQFRVFLALSLCHPSFPCVERYSKRILPGYCELFCVINSKFLTLFFCQADNKSSAWKAYMEEVKKYKEMTCSEDGDRVCPLVK